VMHILGRANWWMPARLDRILPRLDVDPHGRSPADQGYSALGV
jgi:RND superfamily putative drug exporter